MILGAINIRKAEYEKSASPKIIPGNAQHIGNRKEQQDAFGFSDLEDIQQVSSNGVMAVLADGMGGMLNGREASNLAVCTMLNTYINKDLPTSVEQALLDSLLISNNAVLEMARGGALLGEVGSTLVAVVIKDNNLHWISVGDSRAYLFRNGKLTCLTRDHKYANELDQKAADGSISKEEAQNNSQRDYLTSYLGIPQLKEIDQSIKPFGLQQGDRVILCSDGLYGTLSEKDMTEILVNNPQQAAQTLVENAIAKNKPHQDNTTVVILGYEDKPVTVEVQKNGNKERRWFIPFIALGFILLLLSGVLLFTSLNERFNPLAKTEQDGQSTVQKTD